MDVTLLEREEELRALRAALAQGTTGEGRALLLEGPAGIGKSTLLAAARRTAREDGYLVLTGRGALLERDYAFGLARQLLEPALDRLGDREQLGGAAARGAAVLDLPPDGGQRPIGDFAALHGVHSLLAELCRRRPVALLVDDVQWGDVASLRFLGYLVPRLAEARLVLVMAVRSGEPSAHDGLLHAVTSDPAVLPVLPRALSREAAGELLGRALAADCAPEFTGACHRATGGNPLLLQEVARAMSAAGLAPDAGNAEEALRLGPVAVARRVELRLGQLPGEVVDVARAVAVLGDAEVGAVARLAGLDHVGTLSAADRLRRLDVVSVAADPIVARSRISFVHPLVRSAVYDTMGLQDVARRHGEAARALQDLGRAPEEVASHLLQAPPAGDAGSVAVLREAARTAFRRGSPDSARTYLERCLLEPPPDERDHLDILVEAAGVALTVDVVAAVARFREAAGRTAEPHRRAAVEAALGLAQLYAGDATAAVATLRAAARRLPDTDDDLSRRIESYVLCVVCCEPGHTDELERLPALRALPPADTTGARLLDAVIACCSANAGDPSDVGRALAALDGGLVEECNGEAPTNGGLLALLAADRPEVMDFFAREIEQAQARGAYYALLSAHTYRAMARWYRGELPGAEADAREGVRAVLATGIELGRPQATAFLAAALMEQGRLAEAEEALLQGGVGEPPEDHGLLYWYLDVKAQLRRLQGRPAEAHALALAAGRRFRAHGGDNPALVPWRSEAALCLLALGERAAAAALAAEEVPLSERWGAPRALGRSLRVAALCADGARRLELLERAAAVLRPSTARLELAKVLAELGRAHLAQEAPLRAREVLQEAAELAMRCGARDLVTVVEAGLRAAGARPRRLGASGTARLTSSELRVGRLAAGGMTNREIASELFVTSGTVEVHLTSVYRKLGISSRTALPRDPAAWAEDAPARS
ncbi:LuxR family transcriptional regulator [Kineococcus sp. NUM-3379]